jgi:hypothetical protein
MGGGFRIQNSITFGSRVLNFSDYITLDDGEVPVEESMQ